MTDIINPWLDPVEVRRLAEGLMTSHRDPATTIHNPGFDGKFVGFLADHSNPPPPPKSQPATEIPPKQVTAMPQNHRPNPTTAHGPLLERIIHFKNWMHEQFGTTDTFIIDQDGNVVFDDGNHAHLYFLARSLANAPLTQGASTGHVHLKISAETILEVIPVATTHGHLALCTAVAKSLSPTSVNAVMNALSQAASAPTENQMSKI
jgi:hypothetical protein